MCTCVQALLKGSAHIVLQDVNLTGSCFRCAQLQFTVALEQEADQQQAPVDALMCICTCVHA